MMRLSSGEIDELRWFETGEVLRGESGGDVAFVYEFEGAWPLGRKR